MNTWFNISRLCIDIEARLPKGIKPLAGSALVQFTICGLYSIIGRLQSTLTKARVPREKMDFVIAFAEALLSLTSSREDLIMIQTIATEILKLDSQSYDIFE